MEGLKPCPPFKRFTHTYEGGEAWLPASGITLTGNGELTGPAVDRLALYESLLQMDPAEAADALRRAAPENDYAALKTKYDEINRYNISCTKKIDELLAEKLDTDAHLKAISDSLSAQLAVAAPKNKPLTLEELRGMDGGWVWLISAEHSEYDGWYNVRPFHDGSGGIELYGVDNNYYERAITAGSVKVYARKPEGSNSP